MTLKIFNDQYEWGLHTETTQNWSTNSVAGYKINIQKSDSFLYTNNEILEKKYKETIPFKITLQKIK